MTSRHATKLRNALCVLGLSALAACSAPAGDAESSRGAEFISIPTATEFPRPRLQTCTRAPANDCAQGLEQSGYFVTLPQRRGWSSAPFESCPSLPSSIGGSFAAMTGQQFLEHLNQKGFQPTPLPVGGPGVVRVDPTSGLARVLAGKLALDFDWNQPFCYYAWTARAGNTDGDYGDDTPPYANPAICSIGTAEVAACWFVPPGVDGKTGCQGACAKAIPHGQ